ncbi:hypothetical protein DL240_17475 [Lujinxingia litoralis]|uniref:Bacterial surface antigen (D15) domain-containing protein n=1 Tax=Lujinxingia litoralis TaxID=2211119 RepID=A0A328C4Y7_9DELT|nr:hypothetical protein [Lujinxingia litoralis]RAL20372.1 hypothetical protein DL240_17475 [Lujinxingia litoralis]
MSLWRAVMVGAVVAMAAGCAVSSGPRFSPEVQQSFAHEEMRRMETAHLRLYYPEHRREETARIAAQLEHCLVELNTKTERPGPWTKVPIFLPEVEFNNAYVSFGPGNGPHMVLPTSLTSGAFAGFGFTPSMPAVGCHEMVHWVHMAQVHGVFGVLNRLFGPYVTPHSGLDSWVFEGLATYYESKLVDDVGRHGSPLWENAFVAGIHQGHLDGGRLSVFDREVSYGGQYLVGSHFVGFLIERYGEEKIWELIDLQGSALVFPIGVTTRFWWVYGKSLGGLLDEFEVAMRQKYPPRQRALGQERERWLGRNAQLEVSPAGRWATYVSGVDERAALEVFEADGGRILRRELPDVLPGREVVAGSSVDALRLSDDGQTLYFLVRDLGVSAPRSALMRLDVASNRLERVRDEVMGISGDVMPDGRGYVLARADGDEVVVERIDLADAAGDRELFRLAPGAFVAHLRVSPSGRRVSLTLMEDERWRVAVLDLASGRVLRTLSTGEAHAPVYDAYWVAEDRLWVSAAYGERVDVFEVGPTRASVRLTQAPYIAQSPRPGADGALRFLNREGWGWALDRVSESAVEAARGRGAAGLGDALAWSDAGGAEEVRGYRALDAVEVRSDRAYRAWEGLFIPRLRLPIVQLGAVTGLLPEAERQDLGPINGRLGLAMSGRDELGFHNWALSGAYDVVNGWFVGSAAYVNTQLAPLYWSVSASSDRQVYGEQASVGSVELTRVEQWNRQASVQAQRSFYDLPLALSFTALEHRLDREGEARDQRRLVGPRLATAYRAGRGTAYGGTQWLFGLSGAGAYYGEALGSDLDLGDLRAELELHSPLPLSKRHRLRFSARHRQLLGVDPAEGVLRVGGFGNLAPLYSSQPVEDSVPADARLPPQVAFVEPLRGFEGVAFTGARATLGDLNYRYPIIVDRGPAAMLGFLPSAFFSQLNLEAFASVAILDDGQPHAASGASVDAKFYVWVLPMSLRYQYAKWLTDDRRQTHLVGLSFGNDF